MAKEIVFKDEEIDGKNVRVIKQGLRASIKAKAVILSIAGPAIARAAIPMINQSKSGSASVEDVKNLDASGFDLESILIPALDGLSSTITGDKLMKLIDTCMTGVFVNDVDVSDEDKFDFVFDGCMGTMYKVCAFSLKVNFSDLMSDLSTLIGLPKEGKAMEEPKDSGNS